MGDLRYGKKVNEERLARIQQSPQFKNGKFQNQHFTPPLTEGYTMLGTIYDFFFKKASRRVPAGVIPSVKTDLKSLPQNEDIMVWFGHSSYLLQLNGKRFLVDPVFSGNASPVKGTNKSFKGADAYTVSDLPYIDCLLITHDHYDHLDYKTVLALKEKTGEVICGLGVGAHLERWGYKPENIFERDWHDTVGMGDGIMLFITPARHFSGRGFVRNNTLWVSMVLKTSRLTLYLGGDSGYDTHFAQIGSRFGSFDLAILDNGQYDEKWKYIHAHPPEVLQAAKDLKAKRLFPAHSGKFAMANHSWDEPLNRITDLNETFQLPLVTPMIGELVYLNRPDQVFSQWWKTIA